MEIFFYIFIFACLAGAFLYGAFLGAIRLYLKIKAYIAKRKALQAKISLLERENLELARRNKALRELLR